MFLNLFQCKFNNPICKENRFGCKCGKGGVSQPAAPPPAPTAAEIAQQQVNAQIEQAPRAAQVAFDIFTGPTGLGATTAEQQRVRSELFPGESAVKEQMFSNILSNLTSPTGVTPEQQAAVDQRRGTAQSELQTALRDRANIGGGLFGGRSAKTGERAVSDLQARFSEEDINREETARLNALSAALPALQLLFPDVDLAQTSFLNPVPSPESSMNAQTQANQQITSQANTQTTSDTALLTALFGGLGSAVGGAFGKGGIFNK
jgi:hypothetical protein